MNIPDGVQIIQWCNLCNARPADGKLEILRTGEVETEFVDACIECVKKAKTL